MIAHTCDCCKQLIKGPVFFNILLMKKRTDLIDEQQPIHQTEGDYCRECIVTGVAMDNLMSEIDTVKLGDET